MTSTHRIAGFGAALLLSASVSAAAQPAPPPPPAPQTTPIPPQIHTPSTPREESVDQRIHDLQDQLGITTAQMPQWNAFAQAMRDNATSTNELFQRRARAVASMNALENMQSYAQVIRAYADDTDRLAGAFASLYNALSNQQKQKLDALFHHEAAQSAAPLPALR